MKKMLVSLLVLACVAPAMAQVDLGLVDNGDGTATITINTGGDTVRGVALTVTCTEGAKLVDLSFTANAAFNTFIDYFAENGTGGVGETPNQEGHPYAKAGSVAGVAAVDDETFVVCMGVLDAGGGQGGYSSSTAEDLITINTGAGNVCIDLDTIRGGIVGDEVLTIGAMPDCVDVTEEAATCRDQFTGDALALYDRYVTAGKDPSCWCWQFQCRGDGDNAEEGAFIVYRIFNNDLTTLLNSWAKTPETGADPCADFDHAEEGAFIVYSVFNNDLTVLLNNWATTTAQQTAIGDCPSY
ncbi:MAG: hypothetical protein ISS71_03785 [Phycisphaerae bacterium]|nr:hypothetical protein [Phycisphaerae bacterium]